MARELGKHPAAVRTAYLAGLFHDAGLLHTPQQVLYKSGPLNPVEWRVLQEHPKIGHQILLELGHRIPPFTSRAVLEHHERCDGSGYPNAFGASRLHQLGQIVGLADSLQAIRSNQLQSRGLNLANSEPYLQTNASLHFTDLTRATQHLLRRSGISRRPPIRAPDRANLARRLLQRIERIEALLTPLENLGSVLKRREVARAHPSLANSVHSVLTVLHSAELATPLADLPQAHPGRWLVLRLPG